jgi:hypothetical protein
MGAACARQEGRSSALQRLEKGRYSPQAACLCECDRSLASHRYSTGDDAEDGDDSDSDEAKRKMR